MAIELERKYIVDENKLNAYLSANQPVSIKKIKQGYISKSEQWVTRIRITEDEKFAELTVKTNSYDLFRDEFEYFIPVKDGEAMLSRCADIVKKTRIRLFIEDVYWDIDYFECRNLIIAEVELDPDNKEAPLLPSFVLQEVTGLKEFYSENISKS